MQYSPPEDLARANRCLNIYLDLYIKSAIFDPGAPEKKKHDEIGNLAVAALLEGNKSIFDLYGANDYGTWSCSAVINGDSTLNDCALIKEYNNSHRMGREHAYSREHAHILNNKLDRLTFYLNHGGNANLTSSPKRIVERSLQCDITDETLLICAMKFCNDEKFRECAELLLNYDADPNKIELVTDHRGTFQYTALTYAIINRSEAGLALLFNKSKIQLDLKLITNNQSILELAYSYKCKLNLLEMLLEKGADPNQSGSPTSLPLLQRAINEQRIEVVSLLLKYNADLSRITIPNNGEELTPCQQLIKDALIDRAPEIENLSYNHLKNTP
jgi:ankyrin repeat protein